MFTYLERLLKFRLGAWLQFMGHHLHLLNQLGEIEQVILILALRQDMFHVILVQFSSHHLAQSHKVTDRQHSFVFFFQSGTKMCSLPLSQRIIKLKQLLFNQGKSDLNENTIVLKLNLKV